MRSALRFLLMLAACLTCLAAGAPCACAAEESVFFTSGGVGREVPEDPPGIYVNASFTVNLPTAAAESLHRGVSLYFVIEFELHRKRWYWADREIAESRVTRRLSYSLLTRKYYLGGGGLSQAFSSLEEALTVLGSVRRWKVAASDAVTGNFQDYKAAIRLSIDKSRLPRPLQIGPADWDMTSDWVRLPISPTVAAP